MRIAIISGASSGIGKAIACELDSIGLDELWLIGRSINKLTVLQETLSTKSRLFAIDLKDTASYSILSSALSDGSYTIEYLVLSAGVGYNGAFDSLELESISDMVDINCTALTLMTRYALPYMSKSGKIINIASGAGFLPQPSFAVYAATKAYVISFTKGLRYELKKRKIKACAVCPGPVDTEFFSGLKDVKEYKKKYLISPVKVAQGTIKAANKGKTIYTPTFSMKLVHLISKILPTSLILRFYK